jgi:hypothetical protein
LEWKYTGGLKLSGFRSSEERLYEGIMIQTQKELHDHDPDSEEKFRREDMMERAQ